MTVRAKYATAKSNQNRRMNVINYACNYSAKGPFPGLAWHVPATDDSLVFVLVYVFVFIFSYSHLPVSICICIRFVFVLVFVVVCVCIVDKLTINVNGMQIICATWSMALH